MIARVRRRSASRRDALSRSVDAPLVAREVRENRGALFHENGELGSSWQVFNTLVKVVGVVRRMWPITWLEGRRWSDARKPNGGDDRSFEAASLRSRTDSILLAESSDPSVS